MICIIEAHFVTGLVWAALGYEMATGIVGRDAGGGFTRQGLFGILFSHITQTILPNHLYVIHCLEMNRKLFGKVGVSSDDI